MQGYTYCLEPITGAEVWMNELKGHGTGTASIVSVHGSSSSNGAADVIAAQQAAAASTTGVAT